MTKEKQQPKIKSADDLIVKSEQEKLGKIVPEKKAEPLPQLEQEQPKVEAELKTKPEEAEALKDTEEQMANKESEQIEEKENEAEEDNTLTEISNEDDEVDEYGTKVGKPKLYTEEEVQRMIRDRLKRGQHSEQQQDVQQAAKDFTPDPESNESWEVQLEGFVEKTVQKLNQKKVDAEWRKQEEQSQAEFEVKFSEGMGKYKDFNTVVGNKPITNAMMLATRTMKDPAAFLYAACKQQPKELARIAGITDPVAQATEIGRLEERMKKARTIPSAPKPASKISGDKSSELPQISIDARIAAHAKTKIMR